MTARHAKHYLKRVAAAVSTQGAGEDLSAPARAFVLAPTSAVSAAIFQELLRLRYLEPQGRKWEWTARASALRNQAAA